MRELALVGFVCVAFGLGAYRGSGEVGGFGAVNLGLGFASLLAAAVLYARRWGRDSAPAERGPLQDAALVVLALLWGAVLVERAAATSQIRFDWTFEGRYELASATVKALTDLPCSLRATLYHDEHDPRTRRTRLLLEELARHADVDVRQRVLDEAPKEEDFFGIASSNAVVFECGDRWQRVDRATEGAIFEAVAYLAVRETLVVYATTGAGEGDVESGDPLGFSGLATALETEGYVVRRLDSPAISEIPDDAAAVLVIAPERQLHPSALAALRDYLEHGGSLIAMIEPGFESGLETVLAEFGLRSPDAVVIDPASGSVEGEAPGLNPIVYRNASQPVTRGLEANRRTFCRGARCFELRKPRPDDEI
ncbi:MAG: DUF4350 domain-containing protein, partial [Proteobacteria bacterium]|nr:DUF4350 domain-containing protein [Pseudomonadota bacterium]